MTLNFGGGLFPQRDVRETPASTATASLTGVESAISGTGVDVDVATGDVTFTSNDGEINHDNLNNFAANEHRAWESSIAQNIHADNYTDTGDTTYTANETNITLVGTEFRLKNKTSYLSIPGQDFTARFPDTDDVALYGDGLTATGSGIFLYAPAYLPHGAVVTSCIVHGNAGATAETWDLLHSDFAGAAGTSMATANIGTADTSITDATIDNSTRLYYVGISSIDTTDEVYGAIIIYTTDYI